MISNVVQAAIAENAGRDKNGGPSQTALGLLPLSHIYGLTIIAHVCMFVGDEVIILPKFELDQMLSVIDRYSINMLYLVRSPPPAPRPFCVYGANWAVQVPPIIVQMLSNTKTREKYSLKSVQGIYSGAAPLGIETIEGVNKIFPKWLVRQGYGTVVFLDPSHHLAYPLTMSSCQA